MWRTGFSASQNAVCDTLVSPSWLQPPRPGTTHRNAPNALAGSGQMNAASCPKRVRSGDFVESDRCPLYLRKRTSFGKLGSFCSTCIAFDYFSPRLLCRFDLAVRAISISRRIASEREGLSFCCLTRPSSSSGAAFVAALRGHRRSRR
jgi:hypothetical protein